MVRTVIIDDEDHIRDSLAKMLIRNCPASVIIGSADGVASGIRIIHELHPDLVLLDIQMNDGTGFDVLKQYPAPEFRVIFVTAFDQYAVQAFRFSAVDYILKPVNPEHLVAAVERVSQMISEHHRLQMAALEENLKTAGRQDKKIIVKTTDHIYLLDLKNIISLESDSCYTTVYSSEGLKVMVAKTLKEYDEMLTGFGFYRVHKSHLINLSHIKRYEKQDGGYIVLTNDLRIPVATRKREELMELMERMAE